MTGSMVRSFQDPWEHRAAYCGADMKILVTGTGQYSSTLTDLRSPRLWMRRNDTSLPQILHVLADPVDRCSIGFVANPQGPLPHRNGTEFRSDMMLVTAIGAEHHWRFTGATQIALMSLSIPDLAATSHALIGRELTTPAVTQCVRVSDHLLTRLRQLHESACHLAANTPDILAHPAVAKAIEGELIRAMIGCVGEAATNEKQSRPHLRMSVMQRFERAVSEAEDQPLYIMDICAKIGVEERTLRNHCLEYLGISPHRYLWLRRMNQVRRALSLADSAEKTVTMIANDYGFWELGRFSVAYRKLFDESPSTTLRSSIEHRQIAIEHGQIMAFS